MSTFDGVSMLMCHEDKDDRFLERDTASPDTHIRLRPTRTMDHVIDFANSRHEAWPHNAA
jgi:hypothetical protein